MEPAGDVAEQPRLHRPHDGEEPRETSEAGQPQIPPDGQVLHQAVALSILRHKNDPALQALRDRQLTDLGSVETDTAAGMTAQPVEAFEELRAAGTKQSVDGRDLASPELDRHVVDGKGASSAGNAEPIDGECHLPRRSFRRPPLRQLRRRFLVARGIRLGRGAVETEAFPEDAVRRESAARAA